MLLDAAQRKLLYRVAVAYYEDDLTQEEIARRFGLSRVKVSRLLEQARRERIVQIAIVPPQDSKADLERRVEARYGLDEVVVVAPPSYEPETLLHALGQAGAEYLLRILQGNETIAISWGTTLRAVVDALPAANRSGVRVVQMIGGLGRPEAETHGADLTRRMAAAFAARPVLLSAPGIVANRDVRDALLADPQIADALALAAKADIAVVGIGAPTADSVVMELGALLTAADIADLQRQGAVGDIAMRFFDAEGRPIRHDINERIIGLDLEQIRRIPRVIGVAGGEQKLAVVHAAVRGRLISVLITDERTAVRLLTDQE